MYKKNPVKNIKSKVKPKRRYQAKIINKKWVNIEKVNDEFAWRAVYRKQQANASHEKRNG